MENTDLIKDIQELHARFGVTKIVAQMDFMLLDAWFNHRIEFLQEEINEMQEANSPELVVDALVDLVVVALGTLEAFNVDLSKAFNAVQEANMKKVAGANPNRPNKFNLPDLCKPEGWEPPSHQGNVGYFEQLF